MLCHWRSTGLVMPDLGLLGLLDTFGAAAADVGIADVGLADIGLGAGLDTGLADVGLGAGLDTGALSGFGDTIGAGAAGFGDTLGGVGDLTAGGDLTGTGFGGASSSVGGGFGDVTAGSFGSPVAPGGGLSAVSTGVSGLDPAALTTDPFSDFTGGNIFAGTGGPPDFLNQFQQLGIGPTTQDLPASGFGSGNVFPGGTLDNPANVVGNLNPADFANTPIQPDFLQQFQQLNPDLNTFVGPTDTNVVPGTQFNYGSSNFADTVLNPSASPTISGATSAPPSAFSPDLTAQVPFTQPTAFADAPLAPGVNLPPAGGLQIPGTISPAPDVVPGGQFAGPTGVPGAPGGTPVADVGGTPAAVSAPTGTAPDTGGTPAAGASAAPATGPTGVDPSTLSASINPGPGGANLTGGVLGGDNGFMALIAKNPLLAASLGIGAGSLALNALKNTQQLPDQAALSSIAGTESQLAQQQQAFGQAAEQPLLTGQLPPDQEAVVQRALQDAIATTRARYAAMGATGSQAEADQIAYLQQNATAIRGQLEQQMAQTGANAISAAASALGAQAGIFETLMNAQITQDTALRNAIAGFAGQSAIAAAVTGKTG